MVAFAGWKKQRNTNFSYPTSLPVFRFSIFSVRRECINHYISVCSKFSTELKYKIINTEMEKKNGQWWTWPFRGLYADIYLDEY